MVLKRMLASGPSYICSKLLCECHCSQISEPCYTSEGFNINVYIKVLIWWWNTNTYLFFSLLFISIPISLLSPSRFPCFRDIYVFNPQITMNSTDKNLMYSMQLLSLLVSSCTPLGYSKQSWKATMITCLLVSNILYRNLIRQTFTNTNFIMGFI
jgi:hypothetical protein